MSEPPRWPEGDSETQGTWEGPYQHRCVQKGDAWVCTVCGATTPMKPTPTSRGCPQGYYVNLHGERAE